MGWNDNPPKGGPMVKCKGWPGTPLYPPDHPNGPSPDSPLVLCMKRWAARCGAWPWDPEGWDDSYSNRFAHGDGWGDQDHAGIEGLQHWSGTIEPTGNVGEKTHNFARSVKVPQGRTHAGEMAFDSVCVQLSDQAFDDAHPPPANKTTVREAALSRALTQVGNKESPAGSNKQRYGDWYGENGVPWCAIFVSWAYELGAQDIGKSCPSFYTIAQGAGSNDRYDYVPWLLSDAYNGRNGLSITNSPKPGDIVTYDWQWNGEADHTGLFIEWTSGHVFDACEGNTSTSDNSNGGQVMRRSRDVNGQATKFIRVAEP